MATGAILDRGIDVPLFDQSRANLVLGFAFLRLPIKIGHLGNRADELGGIPMAGQTPGHRMGFRMVDFVHLIHLAMATHAADSTIHVDGMVEISVLGSLVNLDPLNGLSSLPGISYRLELGVFPLNLRMAVHADLRGRYI